MTINLVIRESILGQVVFTLSPECKESAKQGEWGRESIPGRGNKSHKSSKGESKQHHMKQKSEGQKCAGAGPQITAGQQNEETSSDFHFKKSTLDFW